MHFQQNQFTRSTQLHVREHDLLVFQRDARGQVQMELEMPYEDILPIRVERRRVLPHNTLRWLGVGAIWVVGNAVQQQFFGSRPLPEDFWGYVLGIGAAIGLLLLYALHNWWQQTIVHTAHLRVVLADHPQDRRQLNEFVEKLETRTKEYLRQEYGTVNPLGIIEPQLRRVAWLRDLEVLSPKEARALTTRLTGQVPAATLRSMGQELEGLFVN